ncbi:MAG: paraquat-inducible protein A [Rhodospirillaceae bacterium]|nr:paraquat-inducible protein A [Rhodospirillaceae bacterium]
MTLACRDCGTLQDFRSLPAGSVASCAACGNTLSRSTGRSIGAGFALSLSVLCLYIVALSLPFLRASVLGLEQETRIGSIVPLLLDTRWVLVALGIGAFIVVFPVVRFALLTLVLGTLLGERRPEWLGRAFRWATSLDLWSMPDVLLIGFFVGYTRVAQRLTAEIGTGGWCFLAAAGLAMVAHATIDRQMVWNAIAPNRPSPRGEKVIACTTCDLAVPKSAEGDPCPRCGARLYARKPDSLTRTTALIVAGLVLYPIANIWPMSVVTRLGESEGRTILYGVTELVKEGMWPLAAIIFCTSIAIPLLKLLAIGWFLLATRFGWRRGLSVRTKLHRLIDGVGRWSNVDIMIIAVFAPLMQFGAIATVHFGIGAACFFAVVILTMLASLSFDTRLMWDAVEQRR